MYPAKIGYGGIEMKVIKDKSTKWKIVFVKTIEDITPVLYRIVNLNNYDIENIPAYRIFDDVVNRKKDIINLRCKNNNIYIIDCDGYESLDDIVTVDELNTEPITLLEWAIRKGEIGKTMISRFDTDKNDFAPSNYTIDSETKLAWTCEKGHTIRCGIATYFSTKCKCPICEMEERGETPSLKLWGQLTNNMDIVEDYDSADNELDSSEINWKSRKEVKFKHGNTELVCKLSDITKGKEKLYFNEAINLSK